MKGIISQTDSSAYLMFDILWIIKAHVEQTRFEGHNT